MATPAKHQLEVTEVLLLVVVEAVRVMEVVGLREVVVEHLMEEAPLEEVQQAMVAGLLEEVELREVEALPAVERVMEVHPGVEEQQLAMAGERLAIRGTRLRPNRRLLQPLKMRRVRRRRR